MFGAERKTTLLFSMSFFIFCIINTTFGDVKVTRLGTPCRTSTNQLGICLKLPECPELNAIFRAKIVQNSGPPQVIVDNFRNCDSLSEGGASIVCCTIVENRLNPATQQTQSDPNAPQLLTPSGNGYTGGCGYSDALHGRTIVPQSPQYAWPWIALLGYTHHNGSLSFECGGTLITKRHILTGGHCVRSDLSIVRLGEHDLSTTSEIEHIDVPVIRIITHPNYDERDDSTNLAILVLGQDIPFSKQIYPICLPIAEPVKSQNYEDYTPFIAGWGIAHKNPQLMSVLEETQVPILSTAKCAGKYKEGYADDVICAGFRTSHQRLACAGDPGGPLMIPHRGTNDETNFYQIGIIMAQHNCDERPNVYTKVTKYVNWIQEQVAYPI